MAKLTLSNPANMQNEATYVSTINANNDLVETALENTLSRDGTAPNAMSVDLDMDGNSILNLPVPTLSTEPATKGYVDSVVDLGDILADSVALATAVTATETSASAAAASETAAASSATSASSSATSASTSATTATTAAATVTATLTATSTTSLAIAVASKTFTTQASKAFTAGMFLTASSAANSANYMHGTVTSYSGTTLVLNVLDIGGSGTKTDWVISFSGPQGSAGATGATGATGDPSADATLVALTAISATPGLVTQTAADVFAPRTIAGTSNLITVTNGDGASGNPTLTVGSNVVRKDVTGTLVAGYTHTVYDHGSLSGVSGITPLPSLGTLQKVSLAASSTVTITAPTAEEGCCILQITNTGAPTSVTFTSFDKQLTSDTYVLTINKVYWVYIYSIGTYQVYQIKNIV